MTTKRFLSIFGLSFLVLVLVLGSALVTGNHAEARRGATSTPRPSKTPTLAPTATPIPSPTTQPGGGTVDYGTLYGDLYIILRDSDGVPILDGYGCVQPIAADGTVLSLYTNPAEDILCEVTEELALLVQTVDFGRLNLGRAPDSVLAHAFDEAVNSMNLATEMQIDPAGRIMLKIDGFWKTIDAPAENLALYIKMMTDGHWITTDTDPISRGQGGGETGGPPEGDGPSTEPRPVLSDSAISLLTGLGYPQLGDVSHTVLDSNELLLAASLLAAAADKSGSLTLDKVIYINSIYGINQVGGLPGETPGVTYFDFRAFTYSRTDLYGLERHSLECGPGFVWVLRPEGSSGTLWATDCMNILSEVHHLVGSENENVRGFVQAADDALQVIEYIHNYRVPEVLP